MQWLNPKKSGGSEGSEWMSVSDLMAGLMLIFVLITIIFARTVVKTKEVNESQCNTIYNDLNAEFQKDFRKWRAVLFKDLTIRFTSPDVLFQSGSADIRPLFKTYLSDFFPRYIKVLQSYPKDIKEVRIEGHTSSIGKRGQDKTQAYFYNMELSQSRTREILQYVMQLQSMQSQRQWLIDKITANGLSYSRLIQNSKGGENHQLSRRVEFRALSVACEKAQSNS